MPEPELVPPILSPTDLKFFLSILIYFDFRALVDLRVVFLSTHKCDTASAYYEFDSDQCSLLRRRTE